MFAVAQSAANNYVVIIENESILSKTSNLRAALHCAAAVHSCDRVLLYLLNVIFPLKTVNTLTTRYANLLVALQWRIWHHTPTSHICWTLIRFQNN